MFWLSPSQPQRLNSWKSIAAYFERDERTVKHWEAQRGLPVHHVPGAVRVYAYRYELTDWLRTADTQSLLFTIDDTSLEAASHRAPALSCQAPSSLPSGCPSVSTSPRRATSLVVIAASTLAFVFASFLVYRHFSSPSLTSDSGRLEAR